MQKKAKFKAVEVKFDLSMQKKAKFKAVEVKVTHGGTIRIATEQK